MGRGVGLGNEIAESRLPRWQEGEGVNFPWF